MAGAPRKGNRPDEVEGGGTGQICFAGAALLCRAANPFREGLKVAAPVSSGRVAFPANERARPPLPPPQPPTSGATGAAPPTLSLIPWGSPAEACAPLGAAPTPPLPRCSLSSSSCSSSSRASAGRHMLPAPSVAARRVRVARSRRAALRPAPRRRQPGHAPRHAPSARAAAPARPGLRATARRGRGALSFPPAVTAAQRAPAGLAPGGCGERSGAGSPLRAAGGGFAAGCRSGCGVGGRRPGWLGSWGGLR